jgi:hypothetical protein
MYQTVALTVLQWGITIVLLPVLIVAHPAPQTLAVPFPPDPDTPPKTISFPIVMDGVADTIDTQPSQCNGQNPSEDCFNAMDTKGGYIWFDNDSGCNGDQKQALETAVMEAHSLAGFSANFPNVAAGKSIIAAQFYMGADYANFAQRISGNLGRAANFKSATSKAYITTSCKDTRNLCGLEVDSKSVGGYAWSSSGWFGREYHYVTMCPPFFTLDTMAQKFQEIEDSLSSGDVSKATNMKYLQTLGQFFLHEMMHTHLVYANEPEITDQYVWLDNVPGLVRNTKAYGPKNVHTLAYKGGGTARSSLNADSYAMLANCLLWWETTGYFPGVPGYPKSIADGTLSFPEAIESDLLVDYNDDDLPVFLSVDLGTSDDTSGLNALFTNSIGAWTRGIAALI